ncbi:MAG TPA: DUF1579 family protein [Vicinamibacteria bacterium]|nr:DUF1579 family protein [Vicinamibacteria bacterium]
MSRIVVRTLALAGVGIVLAPAARAQEPPKPGPEHQKLAYFAGTWTSEAEVKANPFMPGGKYTAKDDCQWFKGGFALKCDSKGSGPMGPTESAYFMGYSGEDKVYTFYGIDNMGMVPTTVSKGSVQGDTWVYTDESKMGGKLVKSRYTLKQLTPTSYSFKWEAQGEGGAWSTLMEGKSTKAK